MDLYSRHANRELGTLFAQLGLTEEFVSADGMHLYSADGTEFLDMTASYGALPLGHNPPVLVEAMRTFLDERRPNLSKGNPNLPEARAAELLCRTFGAHRAIFTSGGAETVNLAIKSARLLTGRRKILAFWNSYHGTTGDALEATGNRVFREIFPTSYGGDVALVPFNDIPAIERAFWDHQGAFACVLAEPVQGEGGVVPAAPGFLERLKELCAADASLLVLDEIQTGMGRSGHLSRALDSGIEPDLLLLSKGLAGGFVPVGCVLYRSDWDPSLGLHHNSTFGGNTLGMELIPRVMERMDGSFLKSVRTRGARLLAGLRSLTRDFPELLREARGVGLLTGLEFQTRPKSRSPFLTELVRQFGLLPAAVAYVRHVHRVCLATTLNTHATLRVTPPLVVTDDEVDRVIGALRDFLTTFRQERARSVVSHLVDKTVSVDLLSLRKVQLDEWRQSSAPAEISRSVAFLVHPNSAAYLDNFDRSFADLEPARKEHTARNLQNVIEPVWWHRFEVRSLTVHVIASPFLPTELIRMGRRLWSDEVELMVLMARERGARLVGLGGLLSVVTRNGLSIPDRGVGITTGNSLTAFAAYEAVVELAARHHGSDRPKVLLLGGYGNIGLALAELLLREGFEVVLFGNPDNPARRQMISRAIDQLAAKGSDRGQRRALAGERIEDHLTRPVILLSATSDPSLKLDLNLFATGSTILDLAMPPALTPEDARGHDRLHLYQVGRVSSPVEIPDMHLLECGSTLYGCLAETLVLGLENEFSHFSLGDLEIDKVLEIGRSARKHGFLSAFEPL